MNSSKSVLTTGEVAKICNVAPRTVSKWFDTGQLRGYRIPGSKDRRIPVEQLVRFMRAHHMPLNGIESDRVRVLILDGDADFAASLKDVLTRTGTFEVAVASSAIEAGAAASELKPQAIVVDVDTSEITPRSVCRFVRGLPLSDVPCLIGTGRDLSDARGQSLLQEGFHAWLAKPFDVRSLVRLIEQQTGSPQPQNNGHESNGNGHCEG